MKLYEVNSKKKYDFSCIYLWVNLINNKKYVGQTQSFYNRMSQYKRGAFNKYMKHAIDKYGIDNFDIIILERDVLLDKLDEREQYWIDYYQSYLDNNGYNICRFAGTTRGFRHTDESRNLMKKIAIQRFSSEEEKLKVRGENNGMYGKQHSVEWKHNHSEWLKNKWATNEDYRKFWHDKMSGENNYFYGKHLCGDKNGHAKTVRCVELNKIYTTVKEAAECSGTSRQNISHALNGHQDTAGGYHWEYV